MGFIAFKRINQLKNKRFYTIVGFMIGLVIKPDFSFSEDFNFVRDWAPQTELEWKGALAESEVFREISSTLKLSYARVRAHAIFKNNLPAHLGIILDSGWTQSEGFFSAELKTSEGYPAVLFQPLSLLDKGAQPALLSHELTHLVHFQKRPHEAPWVQEGVALLAEYVVTRSFNPALLQGFRHPETSLTEGFEIRHRQAVTPAQTLAQYGHVLQYFAFLYENCGGDALLNFLLNSSAKSSGVAFMDEASAAIVIDAAAPHEVFCDSFEKSFRAFQRARFFPKPYPPSASVISYAMKAAVRVTPPANTDILPPYSARAFYLPETDGRCLGERIFAEPSICFEIRLE